MIDNERQQGINPSEAVEEKVSLSDRFGLWLGFHPCTQDQFLDGGRPAFKAPVAISDFTKLQVSSGPGQRGPLRIHGYMGGPSPLKQVRNTLLCSQNSLLATQDMTPDKTPAQIPVPIIPLVLEIKPARVGCRMQEI